jgi:hypothetical protein
VYGAYLLFWLVALELPGHFRIVPWPTTTRTIRDAIQWWHPVALMVVMFLFMLYGHFDRGWSVAYLIAVSAIIVAAVAVHLAAG